MFPFCYLLFPKKPLAADEIFSTQRDQGKFSTRHTASGVLSHVDGNLASLSGFLPQDMLGKSIMDFYHPEDMPLLKEVYETIMTKGQTAGASFCGKPYRFLVHNGCYITLHTKWTSFVNPWSHHLEFVIGHHQVVKGPSNPNVLIANATDLQNPINDTIINDSKIISNAILKLLTEPVSRPSDTVKQEVSKRCKALASFMETLMDEVTNTGVKTDLTLELPVESDLTFSERDSVIICEVSPHHDYADSKSSSETPPNYNQLNYNENLQRFFDSRPATTYNEHDNLKLEQQDADRATVSHCFGESGGSESAGNLSSASNTGNMESITNTSTGTSSGSHHQYLPHQLTEAMLCKHNEDMEKLIIKRHKVAKTGTKTGEKGKKGLDKNNEFHPHGVKRSGSHSWEGEAFKTSKQHHLNDAQKTSIPNQMNAQLYQNTNIELWPPFSVSLNTTQTTHTTSHGQFAAASNIFPTVYYIPTPQEQSLQYMQSYHSMVYGHIYPPMMYQTMSFQPSVTKTSHNEPMFNSAYQFDKNISVPVLQQNNPVPIHNTSHTQTHNTFQRPPSQATSVKADMGSIASASLVNKVSNLIH